MSKIINLLETNDAMVWAEEFVKAKTRNGWTLESIDEGLMVAWFANSMAAQEMKMAKRPLPDSKPEYKWESYKDFAEGVRGWERLEEVFNAARETK